MSRPSVVVYTALFNNYHDLRESVPQDYDGEVKFVLITDEPKHINGWTTKIVKRRFMNPRLENRFYKCSPSFFASDCEVSIYVDSNLKFTKDFVSEYVDRLDDSLLCLFKHPSSKNIQQELELASKLPKYDKGDMNTLCSMFNEWQLTELDVYACTTMAWNLGGWALEVIEAVAWRWFHFNMISDMDQLSLPVVADEYDLDFNVIDDKNFMSNDMYTIVAWKPE